MGKGIETLEKIANGDVRTAYVSLDVKGTIDDASLGGALCKDVIMIRSSRVKKAI